MPKSEEELKQEFDVAKKTALEDAKKRKLAYANVESDMLAHEKKMEAIQLVIGIIRKYSIETEDIVILMENIPYV